VGSLDIEVPDQYGCVKAKTPHAMKVRGHVCSKLERHDDDQMRRNMDWGSLIGLRVVAAYWVKGMIDREWFVLWSETQTQSLARSRLWS
jgi:hypothetical protein